MVSNFFRMSQLWSLVLLLSLLIPAAYCFTTSEIEIFQLQKELENKYGKEMDFYKFLKLPKSMDSTSREIIKNLRKLSRKYHPDKNLSLIHI